jgi:SAM-dependent MidA family methyltransferase
MTSVGDRLRRRIRSEGRLPFASVMEESLYGEGGYYNREELAIGTTGDFVTGSSLTPLFGRLTARLVERLDGALGKPATFLEAGYGSGRHLEALAGAVDPRERRLLGWDRVRRRLPDGVESLAGVDDPGQRFAGLVFSYELFDALPVHRLVGQRDGTVGELWVGLSPDDELAWEPGELSDPALEDLLGEVALEPGQVADLSPDWGPLYGRLASTLERGLLVTCDYGFERRRLLDARVRAGGTLACYRRHRVHRDALRDPGEQDLTAHVDFTTLRRAGEALGFETVALTRQAMWLTALGIFDAIDSDDFAARQQVAALLDPEGMGEEIRVLVQSKGIEVGELIDLEVLGAAGR